MKHRIARFTDGPCRPFAVFPDDPAVTDPAGGGGGDPDPVASTPGIVKNADGTLTVTPEALTARATSEKEQGKRAGIREAAEKLGMSPDEAKKKLDAIAAAEQAAKTEEQRRAEELAAKEAATAAKEQELQARERDVARRALLVGAGALGQDLDDAAALLGTRCPADADDAAVTAAVEKLKTDRAELFTGKTTTPAPSSTPAPAPNGRTTNGAEFGAEGAAEAARRFPKPQQQLANTG